MRLEARQDAYYWRLFGTALSFTLFGLGGVLLRLLVFPLLSLYRGHVLRRRRLARWVVHATFRLFIGLMRRLGVLTFVVEGRQRLGRPGQLILPNHPSLIDVVFLISLMPDTNCVVKHSLLRNPATRGPVRAAGYISNRDSASLIAESAQVLAEGQALIIFPEGTRTTPGQGLRFHRGAAHVAIQAATVLTPVYITVRPTTLTKAEPWYKIPRRRVHFVLRVGQDIDIKGFRESGPVPIASRRLNDFLQAHFTEELARDGQA